MCCKKRLQIWKVSYNFCIRIYFAYTQFLQILFGCMQNDYSIHVIFHDIRFSLDFIFNYIQIYMFFYIQRSMDVALRLKDKKSSTLNSHIREPIKY